MPSQINIINFKVNSINNNANVDFGNITQNSHTANSKNVGLNLSFGDLSVNYSLMNNCYADPDVSDQDQIENPSFPVTKQL
ncbi:spore germination protein [Metabacillus sp. GX 13764]|uniref:spore germination protein n=1 Tax=Metabacillus kandeliae TaxID=2900151 RepID=UPI001E5DCA5C|nr:spore germination protein [Metabacillus kandeliae]MCD7036209.1 spore germination protein [Metabacillus kandeliae]